MLKRHSEHDADRDDGELSVLNIQRTCVHDGPGIRSTVFFRGCSMRCKWCHNPEAQPFVLPTALDAGRSVPELMRVIRKDKEYYRTSGGGVTLSGGEPLAQSREVLLDLLKALRKDGIHVAVETAGDVPWSTFKAALPYVDLFLFDLKVVDDDALHEELTGRPLGRINANLTRLIAARAKLRFRMCVVPGQNDSSANLRATAALLTSLGHSEIELMRYYKLHEEKARRLDLPQAPLHVSDESSLRALKSATELFTSLGIAVGSSSPEAPRRRPSFTPRVNKLRQAIRDAGYSVCLESADLKTTYFKEHGFTEPLAVQRAKLLEYQLGRKQITVYPDELLVGNFTSKRVGGSIWVDYFGSGMVFNLWNIDRQTPVAFKCSRSEKLRFYTRLAPFWATRSLLTKAFPSIKELGFFLARLVEKRSGFNNNMAGIAHYIVNCERLLRLGTRGIAAEVREKQKATTDSGFYDGVLIALASLELFAERYAAQLSARSRAEVDPSRRAELEDMAQVCARVPRNPAGSYHEALQSILLLQIALCTESFENAISLGRLDRVLNPYYEADVAAGRIDYESAKELLALFILKFDELIFLNDGDTLFELGKVFESLSPVETVTFGGIDQEGADCTNDLSYMLLDICELRPIGVNMAARIHRGSPEAYVERIAEVYLNGSPMPALFNDDVYIPALENEHDTSPEHARNYSIVGCVEPVASDDHFANTDAANVNVALPLLQALKGDKRQLWKYGALDKLDKKLLNGLRARIGLDSAGLPRGVARVASYASSVWERRPGSRHGSQAPWDLPKTMDELLERYQERVNELVHDVLADQQRIETALAKSMTTPLASSLYRGCVESGKDVYEGGTTLNSSGIQAVGVTDAADSLLALNRVVFQEGRYSLEEVVAAMDAEFEGEGHQQVKAALLAVSKFGDDAAPDAHLWVERVMEIYVKALRATSHESRGGKYVAGYYGLNTNMVYGKNTPALPSGRLGGTPLANSICPHFGMQMHDLTSALNAVAKIDFKRLAPNGTSLTSTIDTGLFPGESGITNLAGLVRGYFNQGGMQFQPNLIDRELLLDAYRNPGKHKNLVVRIAGYCGYFDELSDDLKLEIINRSYYSQ